MRVLIADDDRVFQATLKDLLEKVTASEIVAQVDSVPALYTTMREKTSDLVLLDWQLPGQTDALLPEALYQMNSHVRIIALDTETEQVSPARTAHVDAFVSKGESAQELLTVLSNQITQWLGQRTRPAYYA